MELVSKHSHPKAWKSTPEHILANEGQFDDFISFLEVSITLELTISSFISHQKGDHPENSQQAYPGFSQPLVANEGESHDLISLIKFET
jgi:hypothetical protein